MCSNTMASAHLILKTKIKGGWLSGRKVVPRNSKSGLPLFAQRLSWLAQLFPWQTQFFSSSTYFANCRLSLAHCTLDTVFFRQVNSIFLIKIFDAANILRILVCVKANNS